MLLTCITNQKLWNNLQVAAEVVAKIGACLLQFFIVLMDNITLFVFTMGEVTLICKNKQVDTIVHLLRVKSSFFQH